MALILDHLNVVVADMERAIAFYGGVLQLEKTFDVMLEGDWIETVAGLKNLQARCVFFEFGGGARLELLQYLSPQEPALAQASLPNLPGVRHFAFNVENIDSFVQRLQESGVEFISPPVEVPFLVGGKRKRLCYFHDPDGTLLEVAEYRGSGQ